jgi:hypothetical protein
MGIPAVDLFKPTAPQTNEETDSYHAVQAGRELLAEYDQQPAVWPPVEELVAAVEADVMKQHGPRLDPELDIPVRATWDEIRARVAAQKAQSETANPSWARKQ